MIKFKKIILIFLSCIVLTAQAQDKRHFLGVLEEVKYTTYNKTTYEANSSHYIRIMRIPFEKKGNEWVSLWGNLIDAANSGDWIDQEKLVENIPAEINWTVAFDGKNVGEVTSKKVTATDDNSDVFRYYPASQGIISKSRIPTIGKRSNKYAGSMEAGDTKVYRPLIANSMPYYKDPDSWKPAKLSVEKINLLRQAFRNKFPKVTNCASSKSDPKPWPYKDKDIKIGKSYASNKGWAIAELALDDRCDEPFGGPAFNGAWFAVSPDHQIKLLRENVLLNEDNGLDDEHMSLVDAGDYDNSGKSQLVFALDGYNRYGYVLFYDDFDKYVEVKGSYH